MKVISMSDARKYRLTLFGATGFTGGLCADYLGENMPEGVSWAIAGRNAQKLHNVIDRLRLQGTRNLPEIVVADIANSASLDAMAGASRVVVTTVAPSVSLGAGVARPRAAQ